MLAQANCWGRGWIVRNFATIVIVMSEDRTKRACYVEVDGERVAELATNGIVREVNLGDDRTSLTFDFSFVRWEETP
jgi:hypothetical protein